MKATLSTVKMDFDIGRAAHAVAKALDCVGIDDHNHGSRVGLLCDRIGAALGWGHQRRYFAMMAGMVHDCGVSSTIMHEHLIQEMEWESAEEHCVLGEEYLLTFRPFEPFALPIRYHHTRWEELPDFLSPENKELANLIFLADRLDVAFALFRLNFPAYKVLHNKDKLLKVLRPHVGTLFAQHIFDAMEQAAQSDSFWLELQDDFLDDALSERLNASQVKVSLPLDEVEALGELLSHIVDAKSSYTHNHSLLVAELCEALGQLVGYDHEESKLLRIVGLLHDVGKLRTPDYILEKPGALLPDEMAQIHSHPMDSKRVLRQIFPNSKIGKWASEHHEKLNGTGYPYGYSPNQIEQPSRILAIADIFQALCQNRPYRKRLPVNDVIAIMDEMCDVGDIDSAIYQLVLDNRDQFYALATRKD